MALPVVVGAPLPAPLDPVNADPALERAALDAKRAELERFLTDLGAVVDDARRRTLDADARRRAIDLDSQRANDALEFALAREGVARSQLTERLRGTLGPELDSIFARAEYEARVRDYIDRGNPLPADFPRPPALNEVDPRTAERITEALLLSKQKGILEANLRALEAQGAERYGVVVSKALSDMSAGAQGQVIMINPEALAVDNIRLTTVANQHRFEAEYARQELANTQRELQEAKTRLNAIDGATDPLRNQLAEQYSQLSKLQYVQLGNVQSPEQVRLICVAGDAKRKQLEAQARALSLSLPGLADNRQVSYMMIRQLAAVQGGMDAPNSVPYQRLSLKFSNQSDADSFRNYAAPSGASITTTAITPVAIIVTVTWP